MQETFGQRLSRLRKEKGLTQEDIAKRIIISPQAVSKWENDLSSPDILVLSSLADILGVSVDELLGHESAGDAVNNENKEEDKTFDEEADEVVDEQDQQEHKNHDRVNINNSGVHVYDDDGSEVHITNKGIYKKEAGQKSAVKMEIEPLKKPSFWITNSTIFGLALIGFLLMGFLWKDQYMGWKMGWMCFVVAICVSSIENCIKHRKICDFAYPVFVVGAYCTLGFLGMYFGFKAWEVYWFLFLTIPAFYLIFHPVDKYIHRNDPKDKWDDDDDDDDDDDNEDED